MVAINDYNWDWMGLILLDITYDETAAIQNIYEAVNTIYQHRVASPTHAHTMIQHTKLYQYRNV